MYLLILPTVFHVLINRHVACPNRIWSSDMFDDQALGGSCVIFPGSHAIRSHDMLGTERSRDKSCDGSGDRFPQSHVLGITWLELGFRGSSKTTCDLSKQVLGSFGNVFLVGTSFARDTPITQPNTQGRDTEYLEQFQHILLEPNLLMLNSSYHNSVDSTIPPTLVGTP